MGGLLTKPVTEKKTETGKSERFHWAAVAMQGWRPEMEDAHIALEDMGEEFPGVGLFAVFDGHGGKAVSTFCKLRFADELRKHTQEVGRTAFGKNKAKKKSCGAKLDADVFDAILRDSFHGVDDQLRDKSNAKMLAKMVGKAPGGGIQDMQKRLQEAQKKQQQGMLTQSEQLEMREQFAKLRMWEEAEKGEDFVPDNVGCTAIVVLVRQGEFIAANAGDSRAILCSSGKAVELSFDHKPASDVEKTRIEKAGGYLEDKSGMVRVNGNLNLSRAIGDLEYKKNQDLKPEEQIICSTPDVLRRTIDPEADEFIVVACDGVWDVMTNQQVCDFVRPKLLEGKDVTAIGEELLDTCCTEDPSKTQGLGTDNMSVIIVKLCDAAAWKAA
eukprot:TRINITY_DN71918_c0_g1_i1.p1 TRINITY_DN71918_c0_g1~~TRINITY_DN71918_c0_g1_i1.p1  ORF type:complete len:384 (-),score=108.50 TRINITY_DN71918_c0_g1_i1:204-1355(-)